MNDSNQMTDQNSDLPIELLPTKWEKPARYMIAAFLIVGGALLLSLVIPIFQIVALAFMFAFVLFLPIRKIASRYLDRYGLFVIIVYLLIAILFVLIAYYSVKSFSMGINNLSGDLNKAGTELIFPPGDFAGRITKDVADFSNKLLAALITLVGRLVSGIGLMVTAFILSLFLLLNLHQARGFLADWIPERYQNEITQLLLYLDQIWVGYVFANVIYGAAVGLGSYIEYLLLGVPYPFVMAVITGVITPIPTVGGLLASIIVAVPCYFLGSSTFVNMSNGAFTLLVYLINIAITQVSYYFVALPTIGKLTKLPTALVFIGVTIGMVSGSILLAFLSVPILSTIIIFGKYLLSKVLTLDHVPGQQILEPTQPGFFSQLLLIKK